MKTATPYVSRLVIEAKTMQTNHELHTAQFMHLLYEGSILFTYVLCLVATVALGAFGLEALFAALS